MHRRGHARQDACSRRSWRSRCVPAAWSAGARRRYPSKPIKLIVPFTPGSPVDVLARVVDPARCRRGSARASSSTTGPAPAPPSAPSWRPTADPDGYTLLIGATSFVHLVLALSESRLRSAQELRAGGDAGAQPAGARDRAVGAGQDRAGIRRATRRPIRASSISASGSAPCRRSWASRFKAVTGTDIASIPYKGGAQAITDMLGGRIEMNFGTHGDAAAADPAGQGPGARGHHRRRAPGTCRMCRPWSKAACRSSR